jgi:hypothetical protein
MLTVNIHDAKNQLSKLMQVVVRQSSIHPAKTDKQK